MRLNLAALCGKYVAEKTPDDLVADFVRRLRPVSTDKPLIRIGSQADGGYLIPDDLEGIDYCFSPGVAEASDLEFECAER